jgi:hypothetical protein
MSVGAGCGGTVGGIVRVRLAKDVAAHAPVGVGRSADVRTCRRSVNPDCVQEVDDLFDGLTHVDEVTDPERAENGEVWIGQVGFTSLNRVVMSTSTQNHPPTSRPGSSPAAAEFVGRAMAAVGVIVGMGLYLAIAPLIVLGTGLVGFVIEVRDGFLRPRPLVGTRHGFPFLDRSATDISDEPEPDADSLNSAPSA